MKKNSSKIVLAVASTLSVVGGLLVANLGTNQQHLETSAANFDYVEGRDKFELNANGDLEVTFTINAEYGYDQACSVTKYWTVYLLNQNTPFTYDYTHKLTNDNDRTRDKADYYFPTVGCDVIDSAGTWTITVLKDATAYHSDTYDALDEADLAGPAQDTGKTFTEVYAEEDWVVCVGPMFDKWWADTYQFSCPIDYYVGRMSEIVPSLKPPVVPDPTPSIRGEIPAGTIAVIIIGVLLLVICGAYFLLFFLFNKWIKEGEDEATRVLPFSFGKKDDKLKLIRVPFDFKKKDGKIKFVFKPLNFVYRDKEEVYKNKEDALKAK